MLHTLLNQRELLAFAYLSIPGVLECSSPTSRARHPYARPRSICDATYQVRFKLKNQYICEILL